MRSQSSPSGTAVSSLPARASWWRAEGLYLAGVSVAAALFVFLYGRIDYTVEPYASADLYHYRQIAQMAPSLPVGVQRPFAFRLLGPYLAGLLPWPDVTAFYWLTVATALVLAVATYGFLRSHAIRPGIAALTTFFFLSNRYLFGFNIWDYFQINDLLILLCLVGLFWALERQRYGVFAVVLAIAVLVRETALLPIPVALVYLWEQGRLRTDVVRLLVACLPGLALFGLVRTIIEPVGGLGLVAAGLRYAPKLAQLEPLFRLVINPFIPFVSLPLLFWRSSLAFFRRRRYLLVYLVLVFISTLFGSNNERLMAPAFLVFYLLMAVLIQHHLAERLWPTALLPVGAALTSLSHEWARFPLPDRRLTIGLSLGALLVITLVVLPTAVHQGFGGRDGDD